MIVFFSYNLAVYRSQINLIPRVLLRKYFFIEKKKTYQNNSKVTSIHQHRIIKYNNNKHKLKIKVTTEK